MPTDAEFAAQLTTLVDTLRKRRANEVGIGIRFDADVDAVAAVAAEVAVDLQETAHKDRLLAEVTNMRKRQVNLAQIVANYATDLDALEVVANELGIIHPTRDPILRPGPSKHSWVTNPVPVDAHYVTIFKDGTLPPVNGVDSANSHQDMKLEEVIRPNLTTWRDAGTDRVLYSSVGWGHNITPPIQFPVPGRWTTPQFTGQPMKGTQPNHKGELFPAFKFPTGFATYPPTGTKPNHAGSLIGPDGRVYTTQPLEARQFEGRTQMCSMNAPDRGWGTETVMDMGGGEAGEGGNQGGSGLDTTGACIHEGQLVPGGAIENVLGITVGTDVICSPAKGFVWPANRADGGYAGVYGTRAPGGPGNVNPGMGMGSLLAISPADFDKLEPLIATEPGMILAIQARDFGRVIVDGDAGVTYMTWLVCTEWSDRLTGRVKTEFKAKWGFDLFDTAKTAASKPFRQDCARINQALKLVDNNTYDRLHDTTLARIRPWVPELMTLDKAS